MTYDISIILPFYKKFDEFKYALEYNKKQFINVNEVILIIDEEYEFDKINQFLFLLNTNINFKINFKIYINTEKHEWRNPAVVINYGIKHAISTYCIIMSPESILLDNAIENLLENTNDNTFCVGQVLFMSYVFYENNNNNLLKFFKQKTTRNNYMIGPVYFGSICCKTENFKKVNYYTESFNENGWGGEDDDVRKKLMSNGIKMIESKKVNVLHLETQNEFFNRLKNNYSVKKNIISEKYDNFIYIDKLDKYAYDNNIFINEIKKIDKIIDYQLNNYIMKKYPIILLTQSYNEEKNAVEFLNNVESFVDGIICLDDSSTDNTWNLLNSDKIILKIKKNRICFNDLENRNLLLNSLDNIFIKNNIEINWILWLDFDERIENDIKTICSVRRELLSNKFKYNILNLPLFHMWNDNEFNAEYPYSSDGLQFHTRLVRHKKNKELIINTTNKLHFNLNHYDDKKFNYNFQIKHLGLINKQNRHIKYNLYTKIYDTDLENQKSYEHLLNDNPKLKKYVKLNRLVNF